MKKEIEKICGDNIHEGLVDFGEDVCPFCMEILVEYEEDKEVCCLNSYI